MSNTLTEEIIKYKDIIYQNDDKIAFQLDESADILIKNPTEDDIIAINRFNQRFDELVAKGKQLDQKINKLMKKYNIK